MAELTMEPLLSTMQAMLAEMRRQNSRDDDLWGAEEIANYMKLSKSTVQQRILVRDNFPPAVILPTAKDGSGGGRRWISKDVRHWAIRHKQS